MNYFTSDIHFGDEKTLKFDNRIFDTSKKFDKYILRLWNKTAKKNDNIYVIGDLIDCDGTGFDSYKKTLQYVKRVKANVYLILGNNEQRVIKNYFNESFEDFKKYCIDLGFKDVSENLILTVAGIEMFLVHKPIDYNKNYFNLFGHTHRASGLYKSFGFNVGCDLNHFRLYSENDIKGLLRKKEEFWDLDKNLHMNID